MCIFVYCKYVNIYEIYYYLWAILGRESVWKEEFVYILCADIVDQTSKL